MTRACRRALGVLLFVFCLFPLSAQDTALQLGSIVDAKLDAGAAHRYAFFALEWTLVSFRVEALSETLDPRLQIYDTAGALVIENDDYNFPDSRDAALQAFLIPESATYTIVVDGVGGSGGDYRLHVLPGYDVLAERDTVMDNSNWEVVFSDAVVHLSDSSLFAVEMTGAARTAIILGLHLPLEEDVYFEAAFESVSATASWQVGLVFRYFAPDRYHRLLLSNQGFWTIERVNGDIVTDVRDWSTHPAIVPGETSFRLGILAGGGHFDVVYNGQVVGSTAGEVAAERGGLGIAMRSNEYAGGTISFAVREALLTVPTRVDGTVVFPQSLLARRLYLMTNVLTRQQLLPAKSEIAFTVNESLVRYADAGVTTIALAQERAFELIAIGVSVNSRIQADANGGCGLVFHRTSAEDYTLAYFTREGDLGVSRRSAAGFAPGIYAKRAPIADGAHYLLVILQGETLHYYVDEVYAGSMPYQQGAGGIGIAAVNYETAFSECGYSDLWLMSRDN